MKRLYSILLLLLALASVYSQENSQNYVVTRTMLNETGTKYIETIQYFDGLGRPFMNVQKGVTPSQSNLVTLQEYDGFGRASKSWLPHVTSSDYLSPGTFKSDAPGTYNNDSRPYSETVYENSPLNRVTAEYGPGVAWSSHPVSTAYYTNTADGELSCKYYFANDFGGLVQDGLYAACELYVTKTTDEDGHVSYVFTDKLGQQILTRQMLGTDPHDTYYVYDDYGNLRFVLPPMYQEISSLSLYGYQYKYDERNRCIEKRLPGCEVIKYVYDKADNLVFSQDGVQRTKGEWTFYLYDVFQRPIMKGVCTNTNTSSAKSQLVKAQLARNSSTRMILPSGLGNTGYTSSFGLTSPTIHTVNYYDDYTFLNIDGFSGKESSNVNATGSLTGSITYLLNDGTKYCTVTHYDARGRVVKVQSDNDMSGKDVTTSTYTFTGKPLVVQHIHTAKNLFNLITHTETYRYTYDHAERLIKTTHQLDSNPVVVLSENTYDNLGRLQTKQLHGNSNLKSTYSYNIRSWMTGISSNPFKENLYYNTGVNRSLACYNGNISKMEWRLGSDALQSYNFTYDHLNRLLSANYFKSDFSIVVKAGNYSEKVLRYDKQGNIRALQRSGITNPQGFPSVDPLTKDLVDNLVLTYNGNQLMSVRDAGYEPLDKVTFNYTDTHGGNDFAYDDNGNLTKDLDKDISSISYNCLNLPQNITFLDNGDVRGISYSYDGNGAKCSVTHVTGPAFTLQPMASLPGSGSIISGRVKRYINSTVYCGNVIYNSTSTDDGFTMTLPKTSLTRILTEEGYITLNGSTPTYHYYLKDHLGNVRVVMNQNGSTVEQSNNYYPFGGIFDSTGDGEQPYKFGGKEYDPMHGLNWCDFGNRQLRNDAPGWMSIDPLCEKYYSISPYVYCNNNPIKYVDPTGRSYDIYINGGESDTATEQLDNSTNLSITRDENTGKLSATGKARTKYDKRLLKAINDFDINVNVIASSSKILKDGGATIGGSFLGNTFEMVTVDMGFEDAIGNNVIELETVNTSQQVNPEVLGNLDSANDNPSGTGMLHEVLESYEGGVISFGKGIPSPQANQNGSVYSEAHNKAPNQGGTVIRKMFNATGKVTNNVKEAVRADYISNGKVIMKFP